MQSSQASRVSEPLTAIETEFTETGDAGIVPLSAEKLKLSICIPTYNRAKHLRRCLDWLKGDCEFNFRYEIVIADNASTDNTEQVAKDAIAEGMPIRYFKAYQNTGMIPNMIGTFHLGRGEYLVYLADDDRLIGNQIAEVVKYLDENPGPNVCYAPMFIYDDVHERDVRKFSEGEDMTFPQGSFGEVFNHIYRTHAFPEMGVYRNSALRSAWVPREGAFYAFSMLAHFLYKGEIRFMSEPFYRQVVTNAIERDRPQGGHDLAESAWDLYRGGLEYFLYFAGKRGYISITQEHRDMQEQMCREFTLQRMLVACRLLIARHEYIRAYEIYARLVFGGFGEHPRVKDMASNLPMAAILQTLAYQINYAAGVHRLVLHGFPDMAKLRERIGRVKLGSHVEIVDYPCDIAPEELDYTAVLVSQVSERQKFLDLGFPPNLVFSQQDLLETIVM